MKVHEYQSRTMLQEAGIPVPPGEMADSPEEAGRIAGDLLQGGADCVVVKAQVHAGGRGKAGFVKIVRTTEEAVEAARFMLGNRMVNAQTGPEGLAVEKLLVAAGVDIDREYYLAVTIDRGRSRATMIASAEGGVDIEHVAAGNPDAIHTLPLDPNHGLDHSSARDLAERLGFAGSQVSQATGVMTRLAAFFQTSDAALAEINPLVVTTPSDEHPDGEVLAIDAKCEFDENALFRHPDLEGMRDPSTENAAEQAARAHGLSYVSLDGSIGCLVNGAGLAMATMDIIMLHGGRPANFLDVGGSADEESVTEAFRIILSDDTVTGVLVNIFGGIMHCDTIATAIVTAAQEVGFSVPLVVRLEGNRVAEARVILAEFQQDNPFMVLADDLGDAACRVCEAVA